MKPVYRAVALILALTGFAWVFPCTAANTTTIYELKGGDDGAWPYAGLLEYKGEFYGTTWKGGTSDIGTIFKLTPPANGQSAWTKTVLHNFTIYAPDGAHPWAGLISDGNGGFYGTTYGGGKWGYGTIFSLTPGYFGSWTETTIYDFCSLSHCEDGAYPQASLLLGTDGALYGTTSEGGYYGGYGMAFRLKLGEDQPFHVIYKFCTVGYYCLDGYRPVAELIADKQGALYGTASLGGNGSGNSGTAFKLTPPESGTGLWTETVLYSFCSDKFGDYCRDGLGPASALVFDTQGNLYGTTQAGGICYDGGFGSPYPCSGTVFKLTPPGNGATSWTESVTHSFTSGIHGWSPVAALIIDSQNNLYGTTQFGGAPRVDTGVVGLGTVFKLGPPPGNGAHRTLTMLTNFITNNDDPYTNTQPAGPVILYQGALYGTTVHGGVDGPASCFSTDTNAHGCGSIFKVPLSTAAPKPTGGGKLKEPHGSGDDDVPASPTD